MYSFFLNLNEVNAIDGLNDWCDPLLPHRGIVPGNSNNVAVDRHHSDGVPMKKYRVIVVCKHLTQPGYGRLSFQRCYTVMHVT